MLAYQDDADMGGIERPSVVALLQKIYDKHRSEGKRYAKLSLIGCASLNQDHCELIG